MGFFKQNKGTSNKDDAYDSAYYTDIDGDADADLGFTTKESDNPQVDAMPAKRSAPSFGGNGSPIAMKLMKPTTYKEAENIADFLLKNNAVVLNLEAANKETASNLIFFLSGVCYAIGGQIKPVAANTYMLTPENMEITEEGGRRDDGAGQPGGIAGVYGDGYIG